MISLKSFAFFTKPFYLFCGGFLGLVGSFVLPVQKFLILTLFLIIADLVTGILAALHRKDKIKSFAIGRTVSKFVMYFSVILISRGVALVFAPGVATESFVFTYAFSGVIAFRELKSIMENAETVTGAPLTAQLKKFEKYFKRK